MRMLSRALRFMLVVNGQLVELEREREIERDQNVFQGSAIIVGCTW